MAGTSKGARSVELFLPFEAPSSGKVIEEITFRPPTFETLLRWESGEITGIRGGVVALMAELSGMAEQDLMAVRFPDAERLLAEFMFHLPQSIRSSIESGEMPAPSPLAQEAAMEREVPVEPGPRASQRPEDQIRQSTDPLKPHDYGNLQFPDMSEADIEPEFGGNQFTDPGPDSVPQAGGGTFDIGDDK